MIRKFNYTGRKKLSRERIKISLVDEKPYKSFTAEINLDELELPVNAKIYIEPYHKSSFMRFEFGTVGKYEVPTNTILNEIPSSSIIQFRVKIVDETGHLGRILSASDRIKPNDSEPTISNRKSIFWIDWDQDIDQQVFRLSFKNDFPTLEINKRLNIGDKQNLVKNDNIFRSLVFPAAIREVAIKIANDFDDYAEGDDTWYSLWLKFIKQVLLVNIEIDFKERNEDDINYWVEEVVAAFCRKNKVRLKFERSKTN